MLSPLYCIKDGKFLCEGLAIAGYVLSQFFLRLIKYKFFVVLSLTVSECNTDQGAGPTLLIRCCVFPFMCVVLLLVFISLLLLHISKDCCECLFKFYSSISITVTTIQNKWDLEASLFEIHDPLMEDLRNALEDNVNILKMHHRQ